MNYYGNIDLKENTKFQFLYGSQLYGTLFGVYGLFTTTSDVNNYYIEKIEFKVINYKGILDIDLIQVSKPEWIDTNDNDPKEPDAVFAFQIEVQGAKSSNKTITKNYIDGNHPKGLEVERNSYLHFDRRLKHIHPNKETILNGIFDSEFYYREGLEPLGGFPSLTPAPQLYDGKPTYNSQHAGGICPRSNMKTP